MVETNYLAYCLFKRDNCLLTEIIGTYTTMQLANEAIDAREVYHAQQGNHVIHAVVTDIPVDHIGNDGYAPIVYEERLIQEDEPVTLVHEAMQEPEVKESDAYIITGTACKMDNDGIYRVYAVAAHAPTDPNEIEDRVASIKEHYKLLGYSDVHFYSNKLNGDGISNPLQLNTITKFPKYEQCSSFKDVLVGWLTNRLYTPLK